MGGELTKSELTMMGGELTESDGWGSVMGGELTKSDGWGINKK